MSDFYQRLAKVQRDLVCGKNQYNSFAKYSYRNAEDILEALKLVLDGLVVTITDDVVMVGDRVYVKATATVSDGNTSLSNSAFAREPLAKKGQDESQITGAASSYARKYALNGLFLIDDSKDADHHEVTDNDRAWVKAINEGTSKLSDITDVQYRKFIRGLSNEK